jgi:F-type H+-transporting ATPase subunit epsilon
MPSLFGLEIYAPEKTLFNAEVSSLCLPEESGYLGVWAHHAPLISTLMPGKITYKDSQGSLNTLLSSSSGVFEIANNRVVILLDSAS